MGGLFFCFHSCVCLLFVFSLFVNFLGISSTLKPTGFKFSVVDGGHPRMVLGKV